MKPTLLLLLCHYACAGIIRQYLRKPIEPSVSNENEIADYTFRFQIETDLFTGDRLLIKFPSQYQSLPGIDFPYQVSIQMLNDLAAWEPLKGTYSCLFRYDIHGFSINVADMKAGYYEAIIYGIQNPVQGGTGSFILESRRNSAYLVDINLLDYNYAFD